MLIRSRIVTSSLQTSLPASEINVINLFAVYIPPNANKELATTLVEGFITTCSIQHPDSAAITVGDFNHAVLKDLHQYVNFPTRQENCLDLAYSNVPNAFRAFKLPPLGSSDHSAILLKSIYVTKHKLRKPTKTTKQIWDDAAIEKVNTELETTDWDIFITDDLEQSVEHITDYINHIISSSVQTITVKIYANNRPWLTPSIRKLITQKSQAALAGDPVRLKSLQQELKSEIRKAKVAYKDKKLSKMSSNMKEAWRGIKSMTHLNERPAEMSDNIDQPKQLTMASELNSFFCRFERDDEIPTMNYNGDASMERDFEAAEVLEALSGAVPGKACGPDNIPTLILKKCSMALTIPLTIIFNQCLKLGIIPTLWKKSTIVPIPKVRNPTVQNHYRPIALTSNIMKTFERLIKIRLLAHCSSAMDINQFAYKEGRSTKDACATLDFIVRRHVDTPNNFVRILFVDFTSAFNTISPARLVDKLESFSVPTNLISLIASFLTNRSQVVRIGKTSSKTKVTNTGCPQGCVLSPVLFSIFTDDLRSYHPGIKLLKYADDMAIIGLLNHSETEHFYHQFIGDFTAWCDTNQLIINSSKTKEMILNFSRTISTSSILAISPIVMNESAIEVVDSFKYLGTIFSEDLKWINNTDSVCSKLKQRFYAFYKFCSFKPNCTQRQYFIRSLILPILTYNSELWFYSCTSDERKRLQVLFKRSNFNINTEEHILDCIFKFASHIFQDDTHSLNEFYVKGRRSFISVRCRTSRFKDSFLPFSVRLLSSKF